MSERLGAYFGSKLYAGSTPVFLIPLPPLGRKQPKGGNCCRSSMVERAAVNCEIPVQFWTMTYMKDAHYIHISIKLIVDS